MFISEFADLLVTQFDRLCVYSFKNSVVEIYVRFRKSKQFS